MKNLEIGILIKRYRVKRGVRQKDLCNAIGITENYLSQIENGNRFPSSQLMDKISKYLNIPPDETLFYIPVLLNAELTKLVNKYGFQTVRRTLNVIKNKI